MRKFFQLLYDILLVFVVIVIVIVMICIGVKAILFFVDVAKILLWLGKIGGLIFIGIIVFVIFKLFGK